jgi:murein DD-endopeptidase MepM/ murein hydrolase activator NlpD
LKKPVSVKSKKILGIIKKQHVLLVHEESQSGSAVLFFKSRLISIVLVSLAIFLVIFALAFVVLAYTPLQQYVPGFLSDHQKEILIDDARKVDALEEELKGKEVYYSHLDSLIEEWIPNDTSNRELNASNISVLMPAEEQMKAIKNFYFFAPLHGIISKHFNYQEKHYGVDVVTQKNEAVKATLNGRVVLSTWSAETGNTIVLQHSNNLISVYKHCSAILKKEGQFCKAGEVIAIIGNTGEDSSGPHLHFELWLNGTPLNPASHMSF